MIKQHHTMPSRAPSRASGQILILMAMMSTTLIILFGMVVSIGHLVQAKINLQNAVDLAAMSGASWQARYLNQISLINYRMRQNYKFVLYDLYVTQSRFTNGFQTAVVNSSGSDLFSRVPSSKLVFGICQQNNGYAPQSFPKELVKIEEDGQAASEDTNMCQNISENVPDFIPDIVPTPIVGINPILIASNAAIAKLGVAARQYCDDTKKQNEKYFEYIMRSLQARQNFQMTQMQEVLQAFAEAFDERGGNATQTVQQTFRRNLTAANAADAALEFINPSDTRSVKGIPNLSSIFDSMFKTGRATPPEFGRYFDVLDSQFKIKVVSTEQAGGCAFKIQDRIYPPNAASGTPGLGVFLGLGRSRNSTNGLTGSPKVPFFVALKATVKPNLLFWPTGLTPTLVAVSAAKPFGSRIGPSGKQSELEVTGGVGRQLNSQPPLANMSFYPGDTGNSFGTISGMGHIKILQYLFKSLRFPYSGYNTQRPNVLNTDGCRDSSKPSFLCLALAPTLYESLFWSVFPNPNGDRVLNALFPNETSSIQIADKDQYAMWDRMQSEASGPQLNLWHETSDAPGGTQEFQHNGKAIFFANRDATKSSWGPPSVDGSSQPGRFGYSIKLASLKEVCDDVDAGGDSTLAQQMKDLRPYCDPGIQKVSH